MYLARRFVASAQLLFVRKSDVSSEFAEQLSNSDLAFDREVVRHNTEDIAQAARIDVQNISDTKT